MPPVSIWDGVSICDHMVNDNRSYTLRLLRELLFEAALKGRVSTGGPGSSSGCALLGSSSPSTSVKTVLVSEVDGEGAVMSEGVVASSARGVAGKLDRC